ncbi:MAG: alanine--tRNA ligase [Flavobacteriia bacterium]|nr:alanine--tRNA ligase [Flavobacteriia bacterium]
MTSSEIRTTFLDFFASKGHAIVPSAPLVIKDDPTLMFTNAGMNPFKDVFIGARPAQHPRIADTQKCLRVSGKHNDLEEVGIDTYHHTLFEMLGNWSFGDYFKQEAIEWAWELLTEVYGLNPEQLYVTVFGGDAGDGLAADEEARGMWLKHVAADRILNGSKKDNFWEMGETGPCGPCSEIHIDLRPASERASQPGADLVNADHPQVIEIWNLVFMQFQRKADGSLVPLPAQHVDTGMGFERLVRAIEGKSSNYDTDVFKPYLDKLTALSGHVYGQTERIDIAFRVIADHIRAVAFAIADGQLPASGGAGYVIRRILRRAVRYGYSDLGFREPFMTHLVPVMQAAMGEAFPELHQQGALVAQVIAEEESAFLRTLESGLKRLDVAMAEAKNGVVSGARAFELYDTFGFPLDLTALICRENGLSVDEAGFSEEMAQQKARSRAASAQKVGDWVELAQGQSDRFIGYSVSGATCEVLRHREVETPKGRLVQVVLEGTPFYPEGGGQVGDQGFLTFGEERIAVVNTTKETGVILHHLAAAPSTWTSSVLAEIDVQRRRASAENHSATHLMHHALREVLGTHVEQRGSLVHPGGLRFDFSHFQKISPEEWTAIESKVRAMIAEALPLQVHENMSVDAAKAMGAMALFGEKYGDSVRVIQFGPSIELCGGTHVENTQQLGTFILLNESSVAAGVRRVEALAGEAAMTYLLEQRQAYAEVLAEAKNPDAAAVIRDLRSELSELQKKVDELNRAQAGNLKGELLESAVQVGPYTVIAAKVALDAASAKDVVFQLKDANPASVIALAMEADGKAQLHLGVGQEALAHVNAGQWVRELGSFIQGGGGGQAFYASAGGKNPAGIPDLLKAFHEKIAACVA